MSEDPKKVLRNEDLLKPKDEEFEEKRQNIPCCITKPMADDFDRNVVLLATFKEAIIFVVFLTFVIITTMRRRHGMNYFYTEALKRQFTQFIFATNGSDGEEAFIDFSAIRTATDVWSYMQNLLMDSLYWDYYYDAEDPLAETPDDDKKVLYESLLLGVPRIRQVKVNNDSCMIHSYFKTLFTGCYDLFMAHDEDKQSFGKKKGTAWVYNPPNATKSLSYTGSLSTYGGGGFYQDLAVNREGSRAIIDDLFDNLWISRGTRAIFIDFALYNANMNLYCICKIIFEFAPSGGVIATERFQTAFIDSDKSRRITSYFEYVVYAFGIYYLMEEIREIVYFKLRYIKQFWSFMDMGLLALVLANFLTAGPLFPNMDKVLNDIIKNPDKYGNMELVAYMKRTNDTIFASLVFFSLIKCYQYANFNKTMGQFNNTLKKCASDILCFTVMFFIIFSAYSELAYLLFGSQVADYSNFPRSMLSLFRMILGDFNYDELLKANTFLAPIFFLTYIFLVIFVLLNMFLAILSESYSDVKTEITLQPDELQMSGYLNNMLCGSIMNLCQGNAEMKQAKKALKQMRKIFEKCGFSEDDINMFFNKLNPGDLLNTAEFIEVVEQRAINETRRVGQTPFVELNQFLVQQSRLDALNKNIKSVYGQIEELVTKLDEMKTNRYGN